MGAYRDLATLFMKYGRSDLLATAGLEGAEPERQDQSEAGKQLATDLEKRGPTFVKIGQLLSSRPDLVAPGVANALGRLQDDVRPFDFADVERIVTEELGVRISKAFIRFDREPIAAASLGQVHRATLRTGREVAVKVQRPGVRAQVASDLDTIERLAGFFGNHIETARRYDLEQVVAEFRRVLMHELDYRREAQNLCLLSKVLADYRRIVIPQPIDDYTTGRVLTMEFVHGQKITALNPVVRLEADGRGLAEELIRAYLHQFIVEGFFHADPHPGNLLLTEDGRLGLIDLGMVSHLPERLQEQLLKLLLAVFNGDGEGAANAVMAVAARPEMADQAGYRQAIATIVAEHRDARVADLRAGRTMLLLARVAAERGIRLPEQMALLGKTLLNLEEIARLLAPDFVIDEVIRANANSLLQRRMLKTLTPSSLFASTLEARELAQKLPGRINRMLDAVADDRFKVKVEMIDEGAVIEGLQKVANRITLGLVLAALIVAAGMLMRIPTPFTLLGYPGLAMIFFLAAAAGAIALAASIITSDRGPRQRA
ncbi:MAG: ABC1 kinase family protein [Acidobacteriota bacterium]